MNSQSTSNNHFLKDSKTKFHHNRVVIFNIVITLLITLSILGYSIEFNNNSSVLFSSTFTNLGHQDTIQIYSNYSSKIQFTSLCNKYFNNIIHIQIHSKKGINNYSFEAFCDLDYSGDSPTEYHSVHSYFVSGNYNLTINYNTINEITQNVPLFTIMIREFHGNIRDIQIYDNLIFPFALLSGICLFLPIMIYFMEGDETWDQLQEIAIIKREERKGREETSQEESKIDFRIVKIPGFIKNRRFLLVISSFILLYLLSARSVETFNYLIYSAVIILLIIYESMPHPTLDYVLISNKCIDFKFRIGKSFILEKESIKSAVFEIGEIFTSNGRKRVKRLVIVSNGGEIFYINLKQKSEETLTILNKYGWIEEDNLSNNLIKLNELNESWNKKLLKLYYYNPVFCSACTTNNDIGDRYCKKCGAELKKRPKLTTNVLKVTFILLLVYFSVDLVVILFSYALFIGPLKTVHLNYAFLSPNFQGSTLFNIISFCMIIIAIILSIIQIKLFGKYLTKLEPSKVTAEYSALYIGVPAIHGTIYFIICLLLRYLQFLYFTYVSVMLLLGELLLIIFYLPYRLVKILLKVNYLKTSTREERISLMKSKMDKI